MGIMEKKMEATIMGYIGFRVPVKAGQIRCESLQPLENLLVIESDRIPR